MKVLGRDYQWIDNKPVFTSEQAIKELEEFRTNEWANDHISILDKAAIDYAISDMKKLTQIKQLLLDDTDLIKTKYIKEILEDKV
jgi:hypothetical protein